MPRKVASLFALLTLIACLVSYKFGSAPVAHAQSLPTAPATWSLTVSGGNVHETLSVTKPAGGAGVQHVATCVVATFWNNGTTYSPETQVQLVDGTNSVMAFTLAAPTNSSSSVSQCGLNIVRAANTPMTLQALINTGEYASLNLVGYDAQ